MAHTGGRTPWDASQALTGPARVVYAPLSVAVPGDAWDVVSAVAVSGEYPLKTGWLDFGLGVNAPVYDHSKTTAALTYQQPAQDLFQQITKVDRKFTVDIAEIGPESLAILENTQDTPAAVAADGVLHESSGKKIRFGLYDTLLSYRIAMISYRPSGAAVVTEPSGLQRPPAAVLVLPNVRLGSTSSNIAVDRGKPVNAAVEFEVFAEGTLPAGFEHGFWFFEDAGAIT